MSLATIIYERLERSFGLYRDLAMSLQPGVLATKLPGLPSSTVGEQFWCVVGARESYARAIAAGTWAGFACSLGSTTNPDQLAEALCQSEAVVREALQEIESLSESQQQLLLDLLEHEAAHQGQLIRYLYGLKLAIPESWRVRYALQ
jgi:hypothetical protein